MNNSYDRRAYERNCNEFGISPHTDWRVSGPNRGLGRVYFYVANAGYMPVYGRDLDHYDPGRMSFTKKMTNDSIHMDYIKQDSPHVGEAWKTFIQSKSNGFTCPGVERLNDSIRTYVWAIFGAQPRTRAGILGTGTAFDTQKQFLADVEHSMSSPVDLPTAISRYQAVLQHAGSEVNYVFGVGLYMSPSDMLLRDDREAGYNNLVVIDTEALRLGLNTYLNTVDAPPDAANDTGEKGFVEPPPPSRHYGGGVATVSMTVAVTTTQQALEDHEGEKATLVVAGVAIGLLTLWLSTKW